MKILGGYKNGNYNVLMFSDGTKMRYKNGNYYDCDNGYYYMPIRPESIDLKISNQCDMGCPMCHENSVPNGKHGNILNLPFLDTMLPYTEVSIGGGNPLSHPDLLRFLNNIKERRLIANMTINQNHFMDNIDLIRLLTSRGAHGRLVNGIGVSLTNPSDEFVNAVKRFPNAVVHIINGMTTIDQLRAIANNDLKILILGYKEFRRGKSLYANENERIDELKSQLYDVLPEMVNDGWFKCISFDNLAIKQLNPRRLMGEDEWQRFYMGNDGEFTLYCDAVNMEFAESSTSTERYPMLDDIADMFNIIGDKK